VGEAFLVLLGLVVGAVLTEVQQRFRRKERLDEQKAAEATALRSWHRDEKREVYGELAVAINAVERAASTHALLGVGQADDEALEEMRHAVLDADERLHESLAAASFLAPVEIQAQIRMFSARRAEGLMRDVIATGERGPELTPRALQEQTQALKSTSCLVPSEETCWATRLGRWRAKSLDSRPFGPPAPSASPASLGRRGKATRPG
jgi:hypothetical protein